MFFSNNTARVMVSTPDGSRLVIGFRTHIRVMDASSGNRVGKDMTGHRDFITALVITSDGRRVVSGSLDNTIRVWDMKTRRQIGQMIDPGTDRINSIAIGLNDRLIIVGSWDGAIRIWDLDSHVHVRTIRNVEWGWLNNIAMSLDGRLFASCHQDSVVRVWNVATLEMICQLSVYPNESVDSIVPNGGGVQACVFSPDGKNVIAGYHKGHVINWYISTGDIVRQYELGGWPITKLVLNRNGTRLIISRHPGVEILDLIDGKMIYKTGATYPNCCLAYGRGPRSVPWLFYGELLKSIHVVGDDVVVGIGAMVEGVGKYILPDLAGVVGSMLSWGL